MTFKYIRVIVFKWESLRGHSSTTKSVLKSKTKFNFILQNDLINR
ncbi:MAG: hypothetical protein ACI9DM_002895 [Cyclobacteriaceae bacterium]|jgi:hypothetical protein